MIIFINDTIITYENISFIFIKIMSRLGKSCNLKTQKSIMKYLDKKRIMKKREYKLRLEKRKKLEKTINDMIEHIYCNIIPINNNNNEHIHKKKSTKHRENNLNVTFIDKMSIVIRVNKQSTD